MPKIVAVQYQNDDSIQGIATIREEESAVRVLRVRNRVDSKRNSEIRSSVPTPGLEEITEDGEDEEDVENVFSKSSQLHVERESLGKDVFGFCTPKKASNMALKAEEELNRTPRSALLNTPSSKRGTPRSAQRSSQKSTPNKSRGTPTSNSSTPVRGILKTPSGKRAAAVEPDTPASSRKRVKKTLIRIAETVETNHYSDQSGSEYDSADENTSDEEEDRPIMRGPPPTPRTPARRGRAGKGARDLNTANMADSYFEAQSAKVLTSDRTLNRLNTPRLNQDEVAKLLGSTGLRYRPEIRELVMDHKVNFPKWLSLLHSGFSIVTYGLGSKKSLIHDFHEEHLLDEDCLVVNGYFPSLTVKSILSALSEDLLGMEESFPSNQEHVSAILSNLEDDLYLLVHNIDGPMLRNERAQSVLADLAAHPKVHLVCSIDHINAPLIWDQFKLARFNFIWFDSTTFLPYTEEAAGESVMVKASGGLQLASITHVLAALTPNAKKIFVMLARYQLEHTESHYQGIAFMELYTRCRNEFLITSDLGLRAQLTEFRDHKLVGSKRGVDGAEYLKIPIDNNALSSFLDTMQL